MAVQRGCLLLADIGGYSTYLAGVELEHSHDILADLLGRVVGQLGGLLELAKLEGDAVFCYDADTGDGPSGSSMLALVDGCYFAFRRRVRTILHHTTCTCDACKRIPHLGLKFLVHHGEYVLHEVVGQRELVGREVVLAHRLLKNSVTETTGLRGYALFTRACVDRFGLDPSALRLRAHRESFEDVGEVECYLRDLEERWREEQVRGSAYLAPGSALLEVDVELPAGPATVWEWVTSPALRPRWQPDILRVEPENPGEPLGPGSTVHCVHGDHTVHEEIVDWKPFDYVTLRWRSPLGRLVGTIEIVAREGGGTALSLRMDPDGGPGAREAFASAAGPYREVYRQGMERLSALLEAGGA